MFYMGVERESITENTETIGFCSVTSKQPQFYTIDRSFPKKHVNPSVIRHCRISFIPSQSISPSGLPSASPTHALPGFVRQDVPEQFPLLTYFMRRVEVDNQFARGLILVALRMPTRMRAVRLHHQHHEQALDGGGRS